MKSEIIRNKETGEFACMLGGYALGRGKSGPAIAGLHDLCEQVNMAIDVGAVPCVSSTGHGSERRFAVLWGDAVIAEGMGAVGAYRILDAVEGAVVAALGEAPAAPEPAPDDDPFADE